jgi:hypothetical protein
MFYEMIVVAQNSQPKLGKITHCGRVETLRNTLKKNRRKQIISPHFFEISLIILV